MTSLEYWLWLTLAYGPANPRKWNAVARCGSVENLYEKALEAQKTGKTPPEIADMKNRVNGDKINEVLELCAEKGIDICYPGGELYPQRLLDQYNPPSLLFYTGDISGIDENLVIASVGTRNPSDYSVATAKRLISELVSCGVHIASGFQTGLDSLSHRVAIKSGGITYAVLPCGHLVGYPPENAGAKTVVSEHGAVISEYFPYDQPRSYLFRARNRVLSGISCGALILQAGAKSGALNTASFAVSQGKEVFCIPPHDIYDPDYFGTADLIRTGAVPVFGVSDVLQTYKTEFPNIYKLCEAEYSEEETPAEKPPKPEKKRSIEKKKPQPERHGREMPIELVRVPVVPFEELGGTKKKIVDFITAHGEVFIDEISVGIGDVGVLEAMLTELELDGYIESLPGNRFGLVK